MIIKEQERYVFNATIDDFGEKVYSKTYCYNDDETTYENTYDCIKLSNVTCENELVTNELYVTWKKLLSFKMGDKISFRATVNFNPITYTESDIFYRFKSKDIIHNNNTISLQRPSNIQKLGD